MVNCTAVLEHLPLCESQTQLLASGSEAQEVAGSLYNVIVPPLSIVVVATVTVLVAILSTRWFFMKAGESLAKRARAYLFENLQQARHRRLILPPEAVKKPRELERGTKSKLTYTSLSSRTRRLTSSLLTPRRRKEEEEHANGAATAPPSTNGAAERPVVDPDEIPLDFTPLVVFVNRKSGGQKGAFLYEQLCRNLNPHQVFDLATHKPERILKIFKSVPNVKVLVCGGDGSIRWILNTIESLHLKTPIPVAVLPLGTGNDLARVLGWGRGYNMDDNIPEILVGVKDAHRVLLDRWEIELQSRTTRKSSKAASSSASRSIVFNNYFGIGVDATTALRFHQTRDLYPEWFFSRLTNKLWYVLHGAREIVDRSCAGLASKMRLVCDGEEVEIPPYAEGIILLNVNSFAGGVKMWNDRCGSYDNLNGGFIRNFGRSSMHDGHLDVVAVNGSLHLGEMNVGLARPTQLCQGKEITIELTSPIAMQVDGEPWTQKPCKMTVQFSSQAHMLRKTVDTNGEASLRMQELLHWASDRRILSEGGYQALLKEMSRRYT